MCFVSAPARREHVFDWVEARDGEGSKDSVYDCHAVRLARKGMLEFSIVGVNEEVQKTCLETLRPIADHVKFRDPLDYPAVVKGERTAPYTLGGLISQTQ